MSGEGACAAIVGGAGPLLEQLVEQLGVAVARIDPRQLAERPPAERWSDDALVWMHFVPAAGAGGELEEATLLLRSAEAARAAAAQAGAALTFVALLPSQGLIAGAPGLACELARGALDALLRSEIGDWSARGDRILGLVYGAIEGHALPGQRDPETVRRRTPIGALASVGQLADALRYLGSRRAAYVTGTVLHVDGGWRAYSWIYPARTI